MASADPKFNGCLIMTDAKNSDTQSFQRPPVEHTPCQTTFFLLLFLPIYIFFGEGGIFSVFSGPTGEEGGERGEIPRLGGRLH